MYPKPLTLYSDTVKPEWIDYNGHMSEGYYVLAFGFATDAFLDYLDVGQGYRALTGSSVYTVESHINYLNEVKEGEQLHFVTQLLGFDAKRIHLFHTMSLAANGSVVATTELMLLHVDTQPRTTAMPQEVLGRLSKVYEEHRGLPLPTQAGRMIKL